MAENLVELTRQSMEASNRREFDGSVTRFATLFDARPRGSAASVQERWAFTIVWAGAAIVRVIASQNAEAARAAAERLARDGL